MDKLEFARFLRKNQPAVEKQMWYLLKNRRFANFKFRRQRPIGKYIVDFVCLEKRIIIECDGGHHGDNDTIRDL